MGRAIALILARSGVHIALNFSRSEEDALKTCQEIEDLGVRCLTYKANVSQDAEVKLMVSQVVADYGKLDILVNNAGMTYFVEHAYLEGMKEEYWDDIMGVNVKGMFFCCRAAAVAPGIVQTRWVEGKEDHIARLAAGTPLGRVAGPEDIAEVAFSLIAHAGFVTEQTIVVDGGNFI